MQKVSDLILNINVYAVDVVAKKLTFAHSVDVRGDTDKSWTRGMIYLVKNYMLRAPDVIMLDATGVVSVGFKLEGLILRRPLRKQRASKDAPTGRVRDAAPRCLDRPSRPLRRNIRTRIMGFRSRRVRREAQTPSIDFSHEMFAASDQVFTALPSQGAPRSDQVKISGSPKSSDELPQTAEYLRISF